jgi:preprotein translocase subunit SecD
MGAVRLLRTLAPLVTVAALATACGGGSSSSPEAGGGTTTTTAPATSGTLQLRLVSARYTQHPAKGQEQLGPPAPKDMVETLKNYDCSSAPTELNGQLLECDSTDNVFVLQAPLVVGGVTSAKALAAGSEWYVKVTFDDDATATLTQTAKSLPGRDLALVLNGKVVGAVLVDSSMDDGSIGITGAYDKTSATKLAQELSA